MGSPRLVPAFLASALVLVLAAGAALPEPSLAQTITNGAIRGVATDSSGAPLAGVYVTLTQRATGWLRSVLTGPTGEYRAAELPPGSYDVRAERLGYRPLVVLDVTVSPAAAVVLDVRLTPAEPPVTQVDTAAFVEGALHASLARGTWDEGRDLVDLVDPLGRVASLAALASAAGSGGLEMQGLPDRMSVAGLDGVPTGVAANPAASRTDLSTLGVPFVTLDHAEVASGTDVEWPGYGGGLVSAFSARAPRTTQVRAYGDGASPGGYRGGLIVGGPLVRDSAFGLLGVDARRVESRLAAPWAGDTVASRVAKIAADSFGTDLSGYLKQVTTRTDVVTAFGRFDWQIAPGQAVALRATVTNGTSNDADLGTGRPLGLGTTLLSRDITGSLEFNSRIASRLGAEVSLSVDRSLRDYGGAPLPGTVFAEGLFAGTDGATPGRFERDETRASASLLYRLGQHELKAGFVGTWTGHDLSYDPYRAGLFTFGSTAAFARLQGAFVQSQGGVPDASFSINSTALLAQDSWSPAPGMSLQFGLRIDRETWPTGLAATDAEWARLTGISNSVVPRLRTQVSPRVSISWLAGPQREWLLRGDAGVFAEGADPAVLAEVLTHDGTAQIRRGLGALGAWPAVPDSGAATVTGTALTLLNPGFQAPRTGRASLSIAREVGAGVSLMASGQYRHTDFLPRRSDLNLNATPQFTDQFGRPVYGTLRQMGGMLAATPGSNLRFPGFDRVWALDPSGFSDYWGVTVALESLHPEGLSLWASYTYSRTTDNVPGLGGSLPDAQLSPFPAGSALAGWTNGTSDLDIPHRVSLGAQVAFGVVRLAGVVRYRSGLPFTPGFRDGVDANGDGASGNDPAFVSDTVPGAAGVLQKWTCLRTQVGQFATRNSCRGSAVTSVDARLAVRLFDLGGAPLELVIDGLNLVTTDEGVVDRALYLVDPARATTTDPATGKVTVPLVANPNFGKLLYRRSPAATVRAGVRFDF